MNMRMTDKELSIITPVLCAILVIFTLVFSVGLTIGFNGLKQFIIIEKSKNDDKFTNSDIYSQYKMKVSSISKMFVGAILMGLGVAGITCLLILYKQLTN